MIDLLEEFSEKLQMKKYLFLQNDSFEIYDNVQKVQSNIDKELLTKKLVDVIDECHINNEIFYSISAAGNILGWVIVENPIFIYNTFSENVLIKKPDNKNHLNEIFNLYNDIFEQKIYVKKYFVEYNDDIYYGITENNQLLTFLKDSDIISGDINPIEFKFIQSRTLIYEDIYQKMGVYFLSDNDILHCTKIIFINDEYIGNFKVGQSSYWFKISDSNLEMNLVSFREKKSSTYLKLEHLFYSNSITNQDNNTKKIDEQIIQNRFSDYNEQIKHLKDENKLLKETLKLETDKS